MNRPTHYNRRVRLMEMVEEGIITQEKALLMCLHWMAQDDIDNMMKYNELIDESYSEVCDKLDSGEYYSYKEYK